MVKLGQQGKLNLDINTQSSLVKKGNKMIIDAFIDYLKANPLDAFFLVGLFAIAIIIAIIKD